MADAGTERVSWTVVQFDEGKKPSPAPSASGKPGQTPSPTSSTSSAPDPNAVQLLVAPPNGAAPEIINLKPDLSDAADVLPRAVQAGYFIHGEGYFDAFEAAVRGADIGYQGSQAPLKSLTEAQLAQLSGPAAEAIKEERQRIAKAAATVQSKAAEMALERLKKSLEDIVATATLYIYQCRDESRAKEWLEVSDLSAGARAIIFNEASGLDLVKSIFVLRTYFLELAKKDAALAKAMRNAGPQMQQIAASRWQYLRSKDPKNTPGPKDTYFSKAYGMEFMDASNPARPDLVQEAKDLFPDPPAVTAARKEMLEASATLTSTMVDEGAVHPILYRIWSPNLADALYKQLQGSQLVTMEMFGPSVFDFRQAMSETLRSAYSAAMSMHAKIEADASVVWKYPLLINAAVDALKLAEDAYERIVAEHSLVAAAEAAERVQKAFVRTSEVLVAAQLAVRFIPAPQAAVAALVLNALDLVVGGIALLYEFFTQSEARDAFRAFLSPGDCFAVSDGSYVGVVIGAAFLLFGTLGLKRSTLTVPGKGEIGMAVAGFGAAEYFTAQHKAAR